MSYIIEQIGRTLQEARENKGLSQRDLSAKAGVPQSHISKIENGAVDLRVSSLVELARALDLELMLVPRKTTPAVKSIVRSSGASNKAVTSDAVMQANRELKSIQKKISQLTRLHPKMVELAQIQRQVRDLQYFNIPRQNLESIRMASDVIKSITNNTPDLSGIHAALSQLKNVRNSIAHGLEERLEKDVVRAAYSLDDDHG